jgi:DNA-binding XRE family transcriptional regulator
MLGQGKTLRTENISLTFTGPIENRERAIRALTGLGFKKHDENSDVLSWEEAFPEYSKEELPGMALSGARCKEGITQKELAMLTGIPQGRISEMENGKKPITVNIAKKFGKVLKVNYKAFL